MMATKQKNKRANQVAHTQRRLFERYGITASKATINDVVRAIQSGRGTCVERQSLRVTVWDVVIHEQTVRVVYDKERKAIATALPLPAVSPPRPSGTGVSPLTSSAKPTPDVKGLPS